VMVAGCTALLLFLFCVCGLCVTQVRRRQIVAHMGARLRRRHHRQFAPH
jgi:uncharacterized iron-regulated membrane protein